ncbi:MAG TPA: DinB family protein [Sphingobacteriaceae bacterium]
MKAMSLSHHFAALWAEGRTRFTKQLASLQENDLRKTLPPAPNSAGFLIRHLADVELLFSRNVFKLPDVQVHAKTVIAQRDTGEWTDLQELLEYQQKAAETLKNAILSVPDSSWDQTITTNEFGTKTLAEALGRITTHTSYHAGQLALILKYGTTPTNHL